MIAAFYSGLGLFLLISVVLMIYNYAPNPNGHRASLLTIFLVAPVWNFGFIFLTDYASYLLSTGDSSIRIFYILEALFLTIGTWIFVFPVASRRYRKVHTNNTEIVK